MVGIKHFEDLAVWITRGIVVIMFTAILQAASYVEGLPNTPTDNLEKVETSIGTLTPLPFTEEDLYYLTQMIYFEARSEPVACQEMVAQVTMHRVYDWYYPNTVKEVVWDSKQFSFTHDGKPEDMKDLISFLVAEEIAYKVLSGLVLDRTEGSLYYFNPKLANPRWQYDYTFVSQCGDHKFYKRKETKSWS